MDTGVFESLSLSIYCTIYLYILYLPNNIVYDIGHPMVLHRYVFRKLYVLRIGVTDVCDNMSFLSVWS